MAGINDERLRMMEDEMNRFEEEIGLPPLEPPPLPPSDVDTPKLVIGANTFDQVQQKLKEIETTPSNGFGTLPPPPAPFFIPPQLQRQMPLPPPPPPPECLRGPPMNMGGPPMNMGGPPMNMGGPPMNMGGPPMNMGGPPMNMGGPPMNMGGPPFPGEPPEKPKKKKAGAVLSAAPTLYTNKEEAKKENTLPVLAGPELPPPETQKSSKKKAKDMAAAVAASVITQTSVQSGSVQTNGPNNTSKGKKDKSKNKKVRTAGGVAWEDPTLAEWEDDDFRLFCGDLGNDVTDELLIRTFSKYPSFLKAKVVRDKRTNKTKGFGFVSFKDPQDFIRANKEMNGRYVGSRPIKLRKSNWKNRSLEVVRKKDKEKATLIGMFTDSSHGKSLD